MSRMQFQQQIEQHCRQPPPPLPRKPSKKLPDEEKEDEDSDAESLLDFDKDFKSWEDLEKQCRAKHNPGAEIRVKAKHLYKAIKTYISLMSDHGEHLKQDIYELKCIADHLNKVSKGTKIAGITGGATSVAGGVAAAAGVILCPFTAGASLGLTVLGVGVAAAGGVTGASAAIVNKTSAAVDTKKIRSILKDFDERFKKIMTCKEFVNEGIVQLKPYDLSALNEITSKKVAKVVNGAIADANAVDSGESSKASGLVTGFALALDFYFTSGKKGNEVKKGLESKFGSKISKLVDELNKALDELTKIKDLFSAHFEEA
ncbi:apolipoprotein L3-like [Cololabis saira]|uniref:apolipoprotein L3-like n=1 Tax=Cololabis saira TaxID=129043 RepID=UPI002AD3484B|nr:apolipoprotein L3-like [Cololabis saira]